MIRRTLAMTAVLVAALLPFSARAAPAAPDLLALDADHVTAYRDLLEQGDMLVVALYEIAYAALPTGDVSVNFIARLVDSDDDILAAAAPYPYNRSGYGKGVVSFYLTAEQTEDAGFTNSAGAWSSWPVTGIKAVLQGSPQVFATVPSTTQTLGASAHATGSGGATNRTQLSREIVRLAAELQSAWGVALLVQGQPRLNATYGTGYFSLAIPGLHILAPEALPVTSMSPVPPEAVSGIGDFAEAARDRDKTNKVWGQGFRQLATDFGLPVGIIGGIALLVVAIGLIALMAQRFGAGGVGLGLAIGVAILLPVGMNTGWVPWEFGAFALALIVSGALIKVVKDQISTS